MAKSIKFTDNTYLDSTSIVYNQTSLNKKLEATDTAVINAQNTASSALNTVNTFLNNKGTGIAVLYGDTNINISGSYSHYPPIPLILDRTTTQLFYGAENGIAVTKSGYYLVSGAINTDLNGENLQIHVKRSDGATLFIIDTGNRSGMVSMGIPLINVYLTAGQSVSLIVGASSPRTYMFRGGRTMLNLVSLDIS